MQSREEALARLTEAATSRGANAVIAMRFDANEVSAGYKRSSRMAPRFALRRTHSPIVRY